MQRRGVPQVYSFGGAAEQRPTPEFMRVGVRRFLHAGISNRLHSGHRHTYQVVGVSEPEEISRGRGVPTCPHPLASNGLGIIRKVHDDTPTQGPPRGACIHRRYHDTCKVNSAIDNRNSSTYSSSQLTPTQKPE